MREREREIQRETHRERLIDYYEELAHRIMEAESFYSLPSVNWQESWWCSLKT